MSNSKIHKLVFTRDALVQGKFKRRKGEKMAKKKKKKKDKKKKNKKKKR